MKNTRTVQRAISVFAVIAFIGFALSSCGGNGSPAGQPGPVVTPGLYAGSFETLNAASVPIATVDVNDVGAAVAHVNANPGVFTLFINDNVALGAVGLTLNVADADLTIIGLGGAREITRTGTGSTLTVNGADIRLTIGNNITLRGRTQIGNVVTVQAGAEFVMLDGALITGNSTSSLNGTVHVTGAGTTFTMRGGSITGNTSTNGSTEAAGGVNFGGSSVFAMQGGSVSGNTGAGGDVFVTQLADIFLSGSAAIGTLTLSRSAANIASVTIETGWTGSITGGLNLRGVTATLTTGIDWWTDTTVLEGGPGFTAALVQRFPLGDFSSAQTDADGLVLTQPIADTHMIDEDGVLVERP